MSTNFGIDFICNQRWDESRLCKFTCLARNRCCWCWPICQFHGNAIRNFLCCKRNLLVTLLTTPTRKHFEAITNDELNTELHNIFFIAFEFLRFRLRLEQIITLHAAQELRARIELNVHLRSSYWNQDKPLIMIIYKIFSIRIVKDGVSLKSETQTQWEKNHRKKRLGSIRNNVFMSSW